MTCRDDEDTTKKITLTNNFFSDMKIAQDPPTNWQAIRDRYQQQRQAKLDQMHAQLKAKDETETKAKEEAEKNERDKAQQEKRAQQQKAMQAKKAAVTTPSPSPTLNYDSTKA